MAFVRVTDPELAAELFSNGLLYTTHCDGPMKVPLWWEWDTDIDWWQKRVRYSTYKFYVQLEE